MNYKLNKNLSLLLIQLLLLIISVVSFSDVKLDYEHALQLAKENKIEESLSLLDAISNSQDSEYAVKASYSLGNYYSNKNDVEKSKRYYSKASKDDRNTSKEALASLYQLSNIAYLQNDNTLSEKYLQEADRRTEGKNPEVKEALGNFYLFVTNDFLKSESNYSKSVELAPKNLRYRLNLLTLYEYKGDFKQIQKIISDMKSINPKINNREIGNYYFSVGNYFLGERYLQRSVVDDKDGVSFLSMGIYYYNKVDKNKGKEIIEEARKAGIEGAEEVLKQIALEEKTLSENK